MCTVVVSFQPGSRIPLLILAVRDEMLGRPWLPPAHHWPAYPDLVGGVDLQAGGTWLAVDAVAQQVSCVLNGVGLAADPVAKRSRGELPLRGAAGEPLPADLSNMDPFHVVTADPRNARLASWDGRSLVQTELAPGTSVVVNSGLDPSEPRAQRLLALLKETGRPDPQTSWGPWLEIAAGADIARDDPRALIMRHSAGDGLRYGSSSVTFLAVSRAGLRYDFAAVPEESGSLPPLTRVV